MSDVSASLVILEVEEVPPFNNGIKDTDSLYYKKALYGVSKL